MAITVPVAVVCVAVIIIVATLMLFIYKHMRRSTIPRKLYRLRHFKLLALNFFSLLHVLILYLVIPQLHLLKSTAVKSHNYYDYVLPTPHVTSSHNPHSQTETSQHCLWTRCCSDNPALIKREKKCMYLLLK